MQTIGLANHWFRNTPSCTRQLPQPFGFRSRKGPAVSNRMAMPPRQQQAWPGNAAVPSRPPARPFQTPGGGAGGQWRPPHAKPPPPHGPMVMGTANIMAGARPPPSAGALPVQTHATTQVPYKEVVYNRGEPKPVPLAAAPNLVEAARYEAKDDDMIYVLAELANSGVQTPMIIDTGAQTSALPSVNRS